MHDSIIGRALNPVEFSQSRYLDALMAFRPGSGLRMDDPAPTPTPPAPTPTPPAPTPTPPANGNAMDEAGRDLGYPKDTPTAQMTDTQRAAYWQHQAQKHEGRFKNLVGDKSFDDTKKALEELAELKKQQQTPAEQALTAARDEGQKAGMISAHQMSAKAIFEGALLASGVAAGDATELVKSLNVDAYIDGNGVNVAGLSAFAQRFSTTPGTGKTPPAPRSFGAGARPDGPVVRGAAGKAEAERRFPKRT